MKNTQKNFIAFLAIQLASKSKQENITPCVNSNYIHKIHNHSVLYNISENISLQKIKSTYFKTNLLPSIYVNILRYLSQSMLHQTFGIIYLWRRHCFCYWLCLYLLCTCVWWQWQNW